MKIKAHDYFNNETFYMNEYATLTEFYADIKNRRKKGNRVEVFFEDEDEIQTVSRKEATAIYLLIAGILALNLAAFYGICYLFYLLIKSIV